MQRGRSADDDHTSTYGVLGSLVDLSRDVGGGKGEASQEGRCTLYKDTRMIRHED